MKRKDSLVLLAEDKDDGADMWIGVLRPKYVDSYEKQLP